MDILPFRTIPLTKGKTAVVDAADYGLVAGYHWQASHQWHRKWYAVRATTREEREAGMPTRLSMHRQILGLTHREPDYIDHRDGNGLNNRRSNLRLCDNSRNQGNRQTVQGEIPYRGVSRVGKRFMARIRRGPGRPQERLGYFATAEEAADAYDAAAVEQFGEFACTNASLGLRRRITGR